MLRLLSVPYLGTAESEVVLVDWLVVEGAPLHRGQPVAVVETLKASFEVEAEGDGVLLRRLARTGERVAVQAPLGVVGDQNGPVDEAELRRLIAAPREAAPSPPPAPRAAVAAAAASSQPAAPAAKRRAAELGIELASVKGTGRGGMVRVEDVERAAAARPAALTAGGQEAGWLDPEFVSHLRGDVEAFARLSSDFKVALYRRHGATLGDGIVLAPGSAIVAERLVLGRGSRLGEECRITARELVAGELLQLGARCRLRCRKMSFGDNAFFAEDVEVGGGGAMDPEAELRLGSHGFVGEHAHLNPCRPLVIGDEVVVSRGAVLMTHSFGSSVLRGYPSRFAGIDIGSFCQIGIGCVLFPGTAMGDGSILLSGSSLVTAVPAGRLFGGVPARDLKAASSEPEGGVMSVAEQLLAELARQLELRGQRVQLDGARRLVVTHAGGKHVVRLGERLEPGGEDGAAEDIRVCVAVDEATWQAQPEGRVVIDLAGPRIRGRLGPLAVALREFLRKRGVRLEPRAWTYPGGWL
jgi:acetyltransferase-like isoleucine patch superfamily enzyme